jgi:hypothetical protein
MENCLKCEPVPENDTDINCTECAPGFEYDPSPEIKKCKKSCQSGEIYILKDDECHQCPAVGSNCQECDPLTGTCLKCPVGYSPDLIAIGACNKFEPNTQLDVILVRYDNQNEDILVSFNK